MERPCQNCGHLGGDPRWCRHCDTVAPHELPTLERHRRLDWPLLFGVITTIALGVAAYATLVYLLLGVAIAVTGW